MGKNSTGYTISFAGGNTWINYVRVSDTEIEVKRNDKLVGSIRKVEGGWQFWPKGHKTGDLVWSSINLAKRHFEGR